MTQFIYKWRPVLPMMRRSVKTQNSNSGLIFCTLVQLIITMFLSLESQIYPAKNGP